VIRARCRLALLRFSSRGTPSRLPAAVPPVHVSQQRDLDSFAYVPARGLLLRGACPSIHAPPSHRHDGDLRCAHLRLGSVRRRRCAVGGDITSHQPDLLPTCRRDSAGSITVSEAPTLIEVMMPALTCAARGVTPPACHRRACDLGAPQPPPLRASTAPRASTPGSRGDRDC
jgi:hypothetical protein